MYSFIDGAPPQHVRGRRPLHPVTKKPELLGFYMPDSAYAKKANDFTSAHAFNPITDKEIHAITTKLKAPAHHKECDVVKEHHKGRKFSMTLCLMTMKTGAHKERPGSPNRYGGYDEDGISIHVPDGAIALAVEDARLKRRVATRKYYGNPRKLKDWYKRENQKIQDELWAKLGKPNLPVPLKQRQHVETAGWLSPTPGSRSRSTSPWKWQPPTPERIRPGSKNDLYNLDAVLRSPDPTYPPPSMLATPPSAKASPDAPNTEGEAAPSTPAPADGNAGEAGSAVSPDAMASPDALAA